MTSRLCANLFCNALPCIQLSPLLRGFFNVHMCDSTPCSWVLCFVIYLHNCNHVLHFPPYTMDVNPLVSETPPFLLHISSRPNYRLHYKNKETKGYCLFCCNSNKEFEVVETSRVFILCWQWKGIFIQSLGNSKIISRLKFTFCLLLLRMQHIYFLGSTDVSFTSSKMCAIRFQLAYIYM